MAQENKEEAPSLDEEEKALIPKPRKTDKALGSLLTLRETLKRRKPAFKRQESWRLKRLKPSWRRPKGIDNKMRLKRKGWPKPVSAGHRSPKKVRGLHPSGFREVVVFSLKDLDDISLNQAIRIGHTVGGRKRMAILKKAQELKIHVLNTRVRPVEAY